MNSQHIAVSEYDVIPGDRRQIARLLSVSAEHFYIASQWKSVVQFRSSIAKSKDTLYIVHTSIHDYGDRKGVKRWTQAGQYSCQGCWHSSRNDWAGLWQYSPDNINGPLYETGKYEMGVITVSPVYLHLLAWLTSDHRGKKPADMAGHQRGGEGRVDPAQKCKHLKCQNRKLIFALHINWCKVSHSVRHKSNQLIKSWTRNLGENEDGWVEKLKPTMMNWCVLCLL